MRSFVLAAVLLAPLAAGCLDADVSPGAPVASDPLTEGVTTDPGWPALEDASIRPGVLVQAKTRTCPSNFLFARPDNSSLFLGITAACVRDMAVGEFVLIDPAGAKADAMIVYHSWATMAEVGEKDASALEYNDFAVLLLMPWTRPLAHPAMLRYGGPLAVADVGALTDGSLVRTYVPPEPGMPDVGMRDALVTGRVPDWAVLAHMAPPALPGSLGTGVLTTDSRALGITVNLGVLPNPGATGIVRIDSVLDYARTHANLQIELLTWDVLETPVR